MIAHRQHRPDEDRPGFRPLGQLGRAVTVHVGDVGYATLGREAAKRGLTAGGLAQRLFDAGFAALFGGTGDVGLEDKVKEALDGRLYLPGAAGRGRRLHDGADPAPAVPAAGEPGRAGDHGGGDPPARGAAGGEPEVDGELRRPVVTAPTGKARVAGTAAVEAPSSGRGLDHGNTEGRSGTAREAPSTGCGTAAATSTVGVQPAAHSTREDDAGSVPPTAAPAPRSRGDPVASASPAERDDPDREPTDLERRECRAFQIAGNGPAGIARLTGLPVDLVKRALRR